MTQNARRDQGRRHKRDQGRRHKKGPGEEAQEGTRGGGTRRDQGRRHKKGPGEEAQEGTRGGGTRRDQGRRHKKGPGEEALACTMVPLISGAASSGRARSSLNCTKVKGSSFVSKICDLIQAPIRAANMTTTAL